MLRLIVSILIIPALSATVSGRGPSAGTGPVPLANADAPAKEYRLPKFHGEYGLYPTGTGMPFYKYRSVQAAVPLIVAGGVLFGNDMAFRDMRNDYLGKDWRYHYDDYLQYSPAAIMIGLKAFGVQGRSSWGRMLTSSAFAVAGTLIMANGTKLLGLRERPDGSGRNSFPSGHTATAFVTATMLHKEYGTTVSPWFSVGGYTIAAGVGLSRVMNNKHWVSDILAGAGMGILAGELGYFIADKIFRDRGLLRPTSEAMPVDNVGRPSFAGLSGGGVILPLGERGGHSLTYYGTSAGVQGAWFISPRIGFGGQLSAIGARYRGGAEDSGFGNGSGGTDAGYGTYDGDGTDAVLPPCDIVSAQAGVYLSKTVGRRWLLSGKLLGGVSVTRGNGRYGGDAVRSQEVHEFDADDEAEVSDISGLSFPDFTSFTATAGAAMTFVVNNHLGVKAFADLSMMRCRTITTTVGSDEVAHNLETRTVFPLTLGISFDILLW